MNEVREIKDRLDIVDIVGKYVQLKQAGKNFTGLCPFHGEKTPSFVVSPELQRYKCFGCGETGDIFNFIQKIENIDFPESLEKLALQAGVTLEKREKNTQYERLEEINKQAAIYFYKALLANKSSLEYVKNRGYLDENIKKFGIGYAPGGQALLDYIQRGTKYSKQELLDSGLFTEKEGKIKGKFYKRIMFPIRSSSGKVIAFTGRVLPGDDFGPKYMNTPETPIFHKSNNFYGQYESRQAIRKENLVIVCEGTTDVISAHQSGIENIVAPLGTALTKQQLEKISKLTHNVLFLFDSDKAGQAALERAFLLAQEYKFNCFAANTLPYKDIDEMLKADPTLLKKLTKNKTEAYIYMLTESVKNKNLNNYEDYNKVTKWVESILKSVNDVNQYNFYVEKTQKIAGIKQERLNQSVEQQMSKFSPQFDNQNILSKEERYLQLILFRSELLIPSTHDIGIFQNKHIKQILKTIKEGITDREELIEKIEDEELKQVVQNAIFSFAQTESTDKELNSIYKNIAKIHFEQKEKEINVKIAIAEEAGNFKESQRLLVEFQKLTEEKKTYE